MPFVDLPPAQEERVVCSIIAAVKYELPANIVLAVAAQEGGKPGQWNQNKDGSWDVGPLQFNTKYLEDLKRYGITANDVEKAGCYPYELAAWRIRGHVLNDKGDLWTRVANYHSRTPDKNAIYRRLVMKRASTWADWLEARFKTYAVTQKTVVLGQVRQEALAASIGPATAAIEPAQKPAEIVAQPAYKPDYAKSSPSKSYAKTEYIPRTLLNASK
ncbi:hypothetical protein IQ22_04546 [Pseudomonas duriflava]|uniref:Transglycosylase-like protein with SLT domain n=1 Tax=Pseudomonas duriflava TaxID=459528 RepID=A0A562PNX9_9PSED|nr:muramidase [Pseudomonas duriflava]TWI46171.1 hypothetical protein IQ22_04546 [Pseudomonas duriflava]